MSDVNAATSAATPDHASALRLIQACKPAAAAGRTEEADQLLARAAPLAPDHPAVFNELGLRMMQRGDASRARELFHRGDQADPQSSDSVVEPRLEPARTQPPGGGA